MQRINTANKAIDLFGAGKHGYTAGVPGTAARPTNLSADAMNALQEEVASCIEAAGIVLNGAVLNQLLQAIVSQRRGLGDWSTLVAYGIGARVIGPSNKTYVSLVAGNIGNSPAISPVQWGRWGFTLAELNAEAATPAQFDNTVKLATTEFVKRSGRNFAGVMQVGTTTTLTVAQAGYLVMGIGAAAYNVNLPSCVTFPAGAGITFLSLGLGAMTVQRAGSDTIALDNAGSTAVAMGNGDSIDLAASGGQTWFATRGSAAGGAVAVKIAALDAALASGSLGTVVTVKKGTLALLTADLAWAAGTIALVYGDSTPANNDLYAKAGASGAGSWSALGIFAAAAQAYVAPQQAAAAASAAAAVVSAAAASSSASLAHAISSLVPLNGQGMVMIRVASDRMIVRVPVVGGLRHDFAEFELHDAGAYMSTTHAWGLHSIRGEIDGERQHFVEQSRSAGLVSTFEFAMNVGLMSDPFDAAHYTRYGIGHGQLDYTGCAILVNGAGANLRDDPAGSIYQGASLTIQSNYNCKLIDGTVIGTVSMSHTFDPTGATVSHIHNITASGIGNQNSYAAMLPLTGVDRIQPLGGAVATIGAYNDSQTNWGAINQFAAWDSRRPNNLVEMILPLGYPGSPPGDWSADTTSQTFLLDKSDHSMKLYANWRSGTAAVAVSGTSTHLQRYRLRKI